MLFSNNKNNAVAVKASFHLNPCKGFQLFCHFPVLCQLFPNERKAFLYLPAFITNKTNKKQKAKSECKNRPERRNENQTASRLQHTHPFSVRLRCSEQERELFHTVCWRNKTLDGYPKSVQRPDWLYRASGCSTEVCWPKVLATVRFWGFVGQDFWPKCDLPFSRGKWATPP